MFSCSSTLVSVQFRFSFIYYIVPLRTQKTEATDAKAWLPYEIYVAQYTGAVTLVDKDCLTLAWVCTKVGIVKHSKQSLNLTRINKFSSNKHRRLSICKHTHTHQT